MTVRKLFALLLSLSAAAMFAAEAPKPEAVRTEAGTESAKAEAYQPPRLSHPDSWMMVVVPDVQEYVMRPRNHGILELMNGWIVDNSLDLKIRQVLFTGDLVYRNDQMYPAPLSNPAACRAKGFYNGLNSLCGREQWKAFSRMMERLDGYVPYILCLGNHDYGNNSSESRHTYFNDYFQSDRNPLTRRQLVCCGYNTFHRTSLENAVYEFAAPPPDNRKFLVFALEFAPTDQTLAWAKKIADEPRFADHIGIVLTHSYLACTGKRIEQEKYVLSKQGGNPGEGIFRKLVHPAKNIRLVMCGHIAKPDVWEAGIAFSTDKNAEGKSVAQMAFNTQAIGGGFHGNGGDGWLRLLEFLPDGKTVKATTFSPLFAISPSTRHLAWKHDERSEFTFTIE